jgi:hypothetical protein
MTRCPAWCMGCSSRRPHTHTHTHARTHAQTHTQLLTQSCSPPPTPRRPAPQDADQPREGGDLKAEEAE